MTMHPALHLLPAVRHGAAVSLALAAVLVLGMLAALGWAGNAGTGLRSRILRTTGWRGVVDAGTPAAIHGRGSGSRPTLGAAKAGAPGRHFIASADRLAAIRMPAAPSSA